MIVIKHMRHGFPVVGCPASVQSTPSSKRRYRTLVADAARNTVSEPVAGSKRITIEIDWFTLGFENKPDVDNIIKPIQDALKGIVFVDDSQVEGVMTRKHDLLTITSFVRETLNIIDPIIQGCKEYVYVRIYQ
jgi:crossover junction endodeoxyribonuclease RusA